MVNEEHLVTQCLKKDREAQRLLYRTYAGKMYGVCLRYVKDRTGADDILQEGFIKVFEKLNTFKLQGSLEGWIRRIMVNTAINFIKKNVIYYADVDSENLGNAELIEDEAVSRLSVEELVKLIGELPDGKRTVFNLYAYEGYSHKEIATILNISESTSKSQYAKAKKMLQERLVALQKETMTATVNNVGN